MEIRKNAGYTIINSITAGNAELVLGQKDSSPYQFVTWQCKNGTDYFWGHYLTDKLAAEKDLYHRAIDRIEDLQLSQTPVEPVKQQPKREKDHER